MINPLLFLDKGYEGTVREGGSNAPIASCSYEHDNKYFITLSIPKIMLLCNRNLEIFEYIKVALISHEVAHIVEGSFKVDLGATKDKDIIIHIFNILEDMRVEYKMQLKYANLNNYFNILLKVAKSTEQLIEKNELSKYLSQLYNFMRYKTISEDNLEFMSFLLPYENHIKNCDSTKCYEIAKTIYEFIKYKIGDKDFKEPLENKLFNHKNVDSNTIKEEIGKIKDAYKKLDKKEVTVSQNRVMKDVRENAKRIIKMENVFRIMFEEVCIKDTYEGEMNINRQQEAYIDSLIGEEGLNYIETNKNRKVKFDFVIIRDISGSIGMHRDDYYNTVLSVLSSLERFSEVRTACIDFNHTCKISKTLEQKLLDCEITPDVNGVSRLLLALNKLNDLEYKNNKVIFILTDGVVESKEECLSKILGMKANGDVVITIHISDDATIKKDIIVDEVCSFDNLLKVIYELLIKNINKLKKDVIYDG